MHLRSGCIEQINAHQDRKLVIEDVVRHLGQLVIELLVQHRRTPLGQDACAGIAHGRDDEGKGVGDGLAGDVGQASQRTSASGTGGNRLESMATTCLGLLDPAPMIPML